MPSPLFAPPRLRLPADGGERHTTWLETFYDLVFAVAVAALGVRLGADLSAVGVLRFLALFIPLWWTWLGHTVYDTRFDTDDVPQRLLTFGIMLAAAAMAVTIPRAFEGASAGFAAAYVAARACLLLLYGRAYRHAVEARPFVLYYLASFGCGAALWAMSILTPPQVRYALWTIGMAVELATPWLVRPTLRRAPVDTSHLPERLALFTVIVLGELITAVVGSVGSVSTGRIAAAALVAAMLAFVLAACVWWVYFTFVEVSAFAERLGSGQPYIYLHLPLVAGLTLSGVGLSSAITLATRPALPAATRLVLGGGVLLWLAAALGLKLVSLGHGLEPAVYARYAGFAACVATLSLLGGLLPPLAMLGGLVLVMLVFAVLDVRHWTAWSHAHPRPTADTQAAESNHRGPS